MGRAKCLWSGLVVIAILSTLAPVSNSINGDKKFDKGAVRRSSLAERGNGEKLKWNISGPSPIPGQKRKPSPPRPGPPRPSNPYRPGPGPRPGPPPSFAGSGSGSGMISDYAGWWVLLAIVLGMIVMVLWVLCALCCCEIPEPRDIKHPVGKKEEINLIGGGQSTKRDGKSLRSGASSEKRKTGIKDGESIKQEIADGQRSTSKLFRASPKSATQTVGKQAKALCD